MPRPPAESLEIHDISLHEDLRFQRREWIVQRVGWLIGAAVIIAALLGLTGRGWLSYATVSNQAGTLTVDYERFGRWQTPLRMQVTLQPREGARSATIWVSNSYLKAFKVEAITPAPSSRRVAGDRINFEFQTDGSQPLTIVFDFTVQQIGQVHGALGLDEDEGVQFSQFIYP